MANGTIEKQSTKGVSKRGGKRPGAGRPKGAKSALLKSIEAQAQAFAQEALESLKSIAVRGKVESARVSAAVALLDRGYGKPRQALEHTGADGSPLIPPGAIQVLLVAAANAEIGGDDSTRDSINGSTNLNEIGSGGDSD